MPILASAGSRTGGLRALSLMMGHFSSLGRATVGGYIAGTNAANEPKA